MMAVNSTTRQQALSIDTVIASNPTLPTYREPEAALIASRSSYGSEFAQQAYPAALDRNASYGSYASSFSRSNNNQAPSFQGTLPSPTVMMADIVAANAARQLSQGSNNIPDNNSPIDGPVASFSSGTSDNSALAALKSKFLVSESDLVLDRSKVLGEGSFGTVYEGVLRGSTRVAVKCVKSGFNQRAAKSFIREVKNWEGIVQKNSKF